MVAQQGAMGPVEWMLLIALSIIWGATFLFVELALSGFPPLTLVLIRVGLAALALHLVLLARGQRMGLDRSVWTTLLVVSIFNNVLPFSLIVWGQTRITGSLASILVATAPIWGVLLAHFMTRDERMSVGRVAGVLLGFGGVVTMFGRDALEGLSYSVLAQLAMVAAGLSYAFAGIFAKRLKNVSPMRISAGQLTWSTALMLPTAAIVDAPWTLAPPSALAVAAAAGLALISSASAYLLYFRILATAGATNVLLVTFLVPISALVMGMGLLGETLEPKHFLGMALIGLGLAAIDGRPARLIFRYRAV